MKKNDLIDKRLFGTDGIRAEFNSFPLTEKSLVKLGVSIGMLSRGAKILIGRDTRESGIVIEKNIYQGLNSFADVKTAGVIPTPELSYLVASEGFELGIMITASHNPSNYNGIKIFIKNGEKISKEEELKIERNFYALNDNIVKEITEGLPEKFDKSDIYSDYIGEICKKKILLSPEILNMKIVVDCANGAFSDEAPKTFKKLGFKNLIIINNKPNGKNINKSCGALYTDALSKKVKDENADIGLAFDGDGDRLICVDRDGFVLDGDYILLIIAQYLSKLDNKSKIVVGTTMSNLGLEKSLLNSGLILLRADVGDRNVYLNMKENRALVGGEQSGHIIIGGYNTGDGLISFIYFLMATDYLGVSIGSIKTLIKSFPQILRSYEIDEKLPIEKWAELKTAIEDFEKRFGFNSRLVIRYSGTEPLIRVMIESEKQKIIDENIAIFERIIKKRNSD